VEHADAGFTTLVALNNGTRADIDVGYWVDEFDATHPVLHDADKTVHGMYSTTGGNPHYVVVDRDMTVRWKGNGNAGFQSATELVESLLAKE